MAVRRRRLGRLAGTGCAATTRSRRYYLTDLVALAVADGVPVQGLDQAEPWEVAGVNSPRQLAELERIWQRREADRLLDAGVRLADPARIDVRGRLSAGQDVCIDAGCVFEGEVVLGDGVQAIVMFDALRSVPYSSSRSRPSRAPIIALRGAPEATPRARAAVGAAPRRPRPRTPRSPRPALRRARTRRGRGPRSAVLEPDLESVAARRRRPSAPRPMSHGLVDGASHQLEHGADRDLEATPHQQDHRDTGRQQRQAAGWARGAGGADERALTGDGHGLLGQLRGRRC
jgi:hypothetical protein